MPELNILSTFISSFSTIHLTENTEKHCFKTGTVNSVDTAINYSGSIVHFQEMKQSREWKVQDAFLDGYLRNKGSSILKCANMTNTLWIYDFVGTVKFTDHEYLKPSPQLALRHFRNPGTDGRIYFLWLKEILPGMEEST